MTCEEVPREDELLDEIKSRTIILKINEKQLLSKQLSHVYPDEIEMVDVTHYTIEAKKIAIKWKKRKESDSKRSPEREKEIRF